jgi:hypothetical protein
VADRSCARQDIDDHKEKIGHLENEKQTLELTIAGLHKDMLGLKKEVRTCFCRHARWCRCERFPPLVVVHGRPIVVVIFCLPKGLIGGSWLLDQGA